MGYDLYNLSGKGAYFCFSGRGWLWALEIARANGWKPAGTKPPDGSVPTFFEYDISTQWDPEDYFSNGGQRVTARDAKALAAAIERALDDAEKRVSKRKPRSKSAPRPKHKMKFTSEEAKRLREFVTFCRKGSFYIG